MEHGRPTRHAARLADRRHRRRQAHQEDGRALRPGLERGRRPQPQILTRLHPTSPGPRGAVEFSGDCALPPVFHRQGCWLQSEFGQ